MPNGKGVLECGYCSNFVPEVASSHAPLHEPGFCVFHEQRIEESQDQRICCQFVANRHYWEDNPRYRRDDGVYTQCSPIERFAWFKRELDAGVLYTFRYPCPEQVKALRQLAHSPQVFDDVRSRLERALLTDDPFGEMSELTNAFKQEGLPRAVVLKILADLSTSFSGPTVQRNAILKAMAVVAGRARPSQSEST